MGNRTLQAVFFDFDGVIVDSNRTKAEAFRTLFHGYDDKVIAEIVDYHYQHGGISRVVKIEHAHRTIIGKPLTEAELASWAARYRCLVIEQVISVDWIVGAQLALKKLYTRVPIFVISGTPEEELVEVIERRGITEYFTEIAGSPTQKSIHIRRLLSKYTLTPDRCVFVGDSTTDYDAAQETGLFFIGIRGDIPFPVGTTVLADCGLLIDTLSAHFVV